MKAAVLRNYDEHLFGPEFVSFEEIPEMGNPFMEISMQKWKESAEGKLK